MTPWAHKATTTAIVTAIALAGSAAMSAVLNLENEVHSPPPGLPSLTAPSARASTGAVVSRTHPRPAASPEPTAQIAAYQQPQPSLEPTPRASQPAAPAPSRSSQPAPSQPSPATTATTAPASPAPILAVSPQPCVTVLIIHACLGARP